MGKPASFLLWSKVLVFHDSAEWHCEQAPRSSCLRYLLVARGAGEGRGGELVGGVAGEAGGGLVLAGEDAGAEVVLEGGGFPVARVVAGVAGGLGAAVLLVVAVAAARPWRRSGCRPCGRWRRRGPGACRSSRPCDRRWCGSGRLQAVGVWQVWHFVPSEALWWVSAWQPTQVWRGRPTSGRLGRRCGRRRRGPICGGRRGGSRSTCGRRSWRRRGGEAVVAALVVVVAGRSTSGRPLIRGVGAGLRLELPAVCSWQARQLGAGMPWKGTWHLSHCLSSAACGEASGPGETRERKSARAVAEIVSVLIISVLSIALTAHPRSGPSSRVAAHRCCWGAACCRRRRGCPCRCRG